MSIQNVLFENWGIGGVEDVDWWSTVVFGDDLSILRGDGKVSHKFITHRIDWFNCSANILSYFAWFSVNDVIFMKNTCINLKDLLFGI